jgi:hypothetical protein
VRGQRRTDHSSAQGSETECHMAKPVKTKPKRDRSGRSQARQEMDAAAAARARAARERPPDAIAPATAILAKQFPAKSRMKSRKRAARPPARDPTRPRPFPNPPGRAGAISPCGIDPAKQFPAINPMISCEIDLAGGGRHIRGECSAQAANTATPATCHGRTP